MVLKQGEKVHIITRRLFEGDLRRHFAGEVREATDSAARVEGYVFVFDVDKQAYIRRPERRVRLIGLCDPGLIINILSPDAQLEDLVYGMSKEKHLVITDGKSFSLDINEFTAIR